MGSRMDPSDPFGDHPPPPHQPPRPHFQEPTYSPMESVTAFPAEFGVNYGDEEEKLPLTGAEAYNAGGFYPPG